MYDSDSDSSISSPVLQPDSDLDSDSDNSPVLESDSDSDSVNSSPVPESASDSDSIRSEPVSEPEPDSDSDSVNSLPVPVSDSDSDSTHSVPIRVSTPPLYSTRAVPSMSRSSRYSTALVSYSRTEDPTVNLVQNKISDLESQLQEMKTATENLRQDYERKCSVSLQGAISGLLTLAETVSKADKQIVFWYEKGALLKVMLRPLGINKKTSVIVARKTTKLKTQVAVVESQFASTSLVCKDALTEVQTLNRKVNNYSQAKVGAVQDEVVEVMSGFDEKKRKIESEILEKEIEVYRVNANINETNAGIERTEEERDRSSNGRENATITSIFGFGGAIALAGLSILCPPVGFAAAGAALVGTGSAVAAVSLNNEVNELETMHSDLSSQLSSLESEIYTLRSQLPSLEAQKSHLSSAHSSIQSLETICLSLRQGASALSSLLLKDRQILTHARVRTERIASDLRSVEYAKTRREITGRLLEILGDLGEANGGREVGENVLALSRAARVVRAIEEKTPKMMRILERAR